MNDKTMLNDLNITGGTSIFKSEDAWLMFEAHATASSEKRSFWTHALIRSIPFITDDRGV
jgi:hypothetical protein